MRVETYNDGVLVDQYDVPDAPQGPLDPTGALATLLAVLGVVPLNDAANAVGLTPTDLIAEAEAWAAAQEANS